MIFIGCKLDANRLRPRWAIDRIMLKDALISLVAGSGYTIRRRVDDARIVKFLSLLHPVRTDISLQRFGGKGDGGYLVPDDLDGVRACFSPGVDVLATFESELVSRGIPCYLADASVDQAPIQNSLIDFEKKYLGVVNDELTTTLDEWVRRKIGTGDGDLLLQMDIEGHEWPVLLNTSNNLLTKFRIIVLELHGVSRCIDEFALRIMDSCMRRLNELFHVVHVHPNNMIAPIRIGDFEIPDLLEVTLLRRDRAAALGPVTVFPHPLDHTCVPSLPDFALPAVLRGQV